MFDLLKLFPIPLWIITILLVIIVIISTIAAGIIRRKIYKELSKLIQYIPDKSSKKKPEIVEKLEKRFEEASKNLEQVNTAALIYSIYSKHRFPFLKRYWPIMQWDYICGKLPNLLLAVGLLGTFGGISFNLYKVSITIAELKQDNIEDFNLIYDKLQEPLQGMAIAFITSLIAIFCSSVLNMANLRWNTSLAKSRLMSSLENYLDNVFQPTIDGNRRLDKSVNSMGEQLDKSVNSMGEQLDKSVNSMVEQQNKFLKEFRDDFLTGFKDNLTAAVQDSLGNIAEEIAEGNREANKLAKQVNKRFSQASEKIDNAANKFQSVVVYELPKVVVNELKPTVVQFQEAAQTFKDSQFPQKLSEATASLDSTQQQFSDSASSLGETVKSIGEGMKELSSSSERLENLGKEISSLNKNSVDVLKLHNKNQENLSEIIPQLKEGANKFNDLQQQIEARANSMNEVQRELQTLVTDLNNYTKQVNPEIKELTEQVNKGIKKLDDRLMSVAEQLGSNNQQDRTVDLKSVNQAIKNLEKRLGEMKNLVSQIKDKL